MPLDIQATGFVGIAFEATAGTYTAPTKYFPIRSESLEYMQETHWRDVIMGANDLIGAVPGDAHVEGDLEIELLEDIIPYFLYASRNSVVKTGAGPNFVYTSTPKHGALPTVGRTLSITVVRAGVVFGYTGCVVGSMNFTTDGPIAICTMSVVGRDEITAGLPVPVFAATGPFGAGMYNLQIPTATTIFDVDTFSLQIEDNAEAQARRTAVVGAAFIKFGAREVQFSIERDFTSRAEFDAFKSLTKESIKMVMTKGANNFVEFTLPVSIKDTYELGGLSDKGELVRVSVSYKGIYDLVTSKSYEIVVNTQESIL